MSLSHFNPLAGQEKKAGREASLPSRRGRMALGSLSSVALSSMHAPRFYHDCLAWENVKEFRKEASGQFD